MTTTAPSLLSALHQAGNHPGDRPLTVCGTIQAYHIQLLVGADPTFVSPHQTGTTLGVACARYNIQARACHLTFIHDLIRFGADMDVLTPSGFSPLLDVIFMRLPEPALLMLDYGADPRVRSKFYRRHALLQAVSSNCPPVAERLLDEVILARCEIDAGRPSPVWWLASLEEIASYLETRETSDSDTTLLLAVKLNMPRMVERLVDAGAKTDVAAKSGMTLRQIIESRQYKHPVYARCQ